MIKFISKYIQTITNIVLIIELSFFVFVPLIYLMQNPELTTMQLIIKFKAEYIASILLGCLFVLNNK